MRLGGAKLNNRVQSAPNFFTTLLFMKSHPLNCRETWHLLHKLATIYNYIDFLSAHMLLKLKLMNLRSVVPIWGWSKASTPYLISGLVTGLSCILCRLTFMLRYLSLASMQSFLLILMSLLLHCYCSSLALLVEYTGSFALKE